MTKAVPQEAAETLARLIADHGLPQVLEAIADGLYARDTVGSRMAAAPIYMAATQATAYLLGQR